MSSATNTKVAHKINVQILKPYSVYNQTQKYVCAFMSHITKSTVVYLKRDNVTSSNTSAD